MKIDLLHHNSRALSRSFLGLTMNCYTARDHGLARLWGSTGLLMDVFSIFPPLDPVVTSSTRFIFQRRGPHIFEIVKEPCKAFLLTWNYTKTQPGYSPKSLSLPLENGRHQSTVERDKESGTCVFQTDGDCPYLFTCETGTMGMTCPCLSRALLAYHRKSWNLGICLR